jgi:hypothetical protein
MQLKVTDAPFWLVVRRQSNEIEEHKVNAFTLEHNSGIKNSNNGATFGWN